jgi:hypothetical protein
LWPIIRMVYSQICSWLDDYISSESPEELLDTWDLTEWIEESEIVDVFSDCFIDMLKTKKAQNDAEKIIHGLIWEYYLLRRGERIQGLVPDTDLCMRLRSEVSVRQRTNEWHKERISLLTASEFHSILGDGAGRDALIKSKIVSGLRDGRDAEVQTVFLTGRNGKLNPCAWGFRFEQVVGDIYSTLVGCDIYCGLGRLRHKTLSKLAASPDGLVISGARAGRLLEFKAPVSRTIEDDVIPYEYYCQIQIQLEVCDALAADYCECKIEAGLIDDGKYIGALAVVGDKANISSWSYVYSPVYPNNPEGLANVKAWTPEGHVIEHQFWTCVKTHIMTVVRNSRWWSTVGLPEYECFWKDVDAARTAPTDSFLADTYEKPLFIDDL